MNYFNKSAFADNIQPWVRIFLIGFIIGISIHLFYMWLNPAMEWTYLDALKIEGSPGWGIIGTIAAKLARIILLIIICLVIPSILYGIAAGKILILLASAYFGFTFLPFENAYDYWAIINLGIQILSCLWCLSLGTLKIDFIEKAKLAIIPFSVLAALGVYQVFI